MKRLHSTDSDLGTAVGPLPLFDQPARVHANASATERAAARRVETKVTGLRLMVLAWIEREGARGLTSKEARALYLEINGEPDPWSVPPRFSELARMGLIVSTGEVRDGAEAWRAAR